MQICPSMPLPTMEALAANINKLFPFYNYFQIDIGDGIFVSNRTVQIDDIAKNYKQINNYQSLVFDFHLMVNDYKTEIKKLEKLRNSLTIKNIFIHFSAIRNWSASWRMKIKNLSSLPIGLTLNPEDQVDDLVSHCSLKQIPIIQIMSVIPGVQGNPFIPETLNKIEQLRRLGYRNKIFLDGAVNDKTLPFINEQKFKPDVVCPGSFLTKAKDLKKNVNYLNKL